MRGGQGIPDKICRTCGRPFSWRAAWARDWPQVQTCSQACKKGPSALGLQLEPALRRLLLARGRHKSACPSEALKEICGDKAAWPADATRDMRYAVNRLAHAGELEVLQQGRRVDAASARGPIRIRKA